MTFSKLSEELILIIVKYLKIEDLQSFSLNNKYINNICKSNKEYISKYFLHKYKVNINDLNNFIYSDLNVNDKTIYEYCCQRSFSEFRHKYYKNRPDFNDNKYSLFKLYMKSYYRTQLFINSSTTSFPIFPNMESCYIDSNSKLKIFYSQPKMISLEAIKSNIEIFEHQPNIIYCDVDFIYKMSQVEFLSLPIKKDILFLYNNIFVDIDNQRSSLIRNITFLIIDDNYILLDGTLYKSYERYANKDIITNICVYDNDNDICKIQNVKITNIKRFQEIRDYSDFEIYTPTQLIELHFVLIKEYFGNINEIPDEFNYE